MPIQLNGLASGLDTQSIVNDMMKVEKMRVETVKKDKVLAEWKKEAWEDMNTKLYSFYKEELSEFKLANSYSQKSLANSNKSLISLNTSPKAMRGSHAIDVTTMAKGSNLTGQALTGVTSASTAETMFGITGSSTGSFKVSVAGEQPSEITIQATDTMSDIVNKVDGLGLDLNINFDEANGRVFLASKKSGAGTLIKVSGDEAVLNGLGFTSSSRVGTAGSDAAYTYNGTAMTSASNEVKVNGLSFNILSEGGSANVSVSQDTDAVYDMVKKFVMKYNDLMMDMTKKVGAESAREYKPLSSEEKEAMSEGDIKLWESKIKSSLLRRDDTLTDITSSMRNTLTLSSGVNTSTFTYKNLSSLGIVTGNYQEKGVLHIAGDKDDNLYADKTNKLREAIDKDPDAVTQLLTSLGKALSEDMFDKMKSTSLSRALTFYNDKSFESQITDYGTDISKLEDKLSTIESNYYKQFTAMEQAIQRSNSTGAWLAQQLGGM